MMGPGIGADGEMPPMELGLICEDLCHRADRFVVRPNVAQSERIPADDDVLWRGTEKVVAVKSELSAVQLP